MSLVLCPAHRNSVRTAVAMTQVDLALVSAVVAVAVSVVAVAVVVAVVVGVGLNARWWSSQCFDHQLKKQAAVAHLCCPLPPLYWEPPSPQRLSGVL